MTILAIDHRIFGSGHGFRSPHSDNRFYWLNGELYTFHPGFGAQLYNVQWTHPNAGERRKLCGQTFRPFHSRRRWGRVMVAWAWVEIPKDLESANVALRELEKALGGVSDYLPPAQRWRPAQAIEAAAADETRTRLDPKDESPVGKADAPHPNQDTPHE